MQKILTIIFISTSLILHGNFFNPVSWNYSTTDKLKFSSPNLFLEQTRSIFDYLPIYAKLPPNKAAPDSPEVLDGVGSVIFWNKTASKQYGQITLASESVVRLPIYDFPGMRVKVNESMVSHVNNDCRNQEYCFGQISIKLPAGTHNVTVELTKTPSRLIGDILSVSGLLIILILLCVS